MAGIGASRAVLGAAGVVVGVYGAYLLLSRQDLDQLLSVAIWLGGGVVAHDAVVAGLSLIVVALGARLLPSSARPSSAVALVVLGSVTILAIPMLGRFGARADNPTLLDRDYWLGWSVIVALALVMVVAAAVRRARRGTPARGRPAAADGAVAGDGPGASG